MKIVDKVLDFFGYSKDTDISKDEDTKTVSYAESPSTYMFDQYNVATDRLTTIREVRELVKKDLRFKMTNLRIAADATRGGFKVIVSGSELDRSIKKRKGKPYPKRLVPGANAAQAVIDDFITRTKLPYKTKGYTRALLRDGDLFLNPVVDLDRGLILDIKMAPPLTIKRNSDEFGQFPDVERAFSQIDPLTQINSLMEIGPPSDSRQDFSLYQMNHIRWLWDETTNYGTSQYASARQTHKILLRMEKAAAVRREFRSVDKRNHKLPEGSGEAEVTKYKRDVGLVGSNGKTTRNAHLLSDFIGTAEVTSLNDGATNLDQMGDIKYFDNLLWLDLLVPKAILTAGEDINRDILKTQYPQYLSSLEDITDTLEYGDPGTFSGIRDIIDLQLLLAGINPQSIIYDVVWSNKTTETALERMERVQKALGSDRNVKIITKAKAIQQIADDFDIEDTQAMLEAVEEESKIQACTQVKDKKQKQSMNQEENLEVKEEITDVSKEDISTIEELESKATDTVAKFFNSVYENMSKNKQVILDESDDEEEDEEDEDDGNDDEDDDSTLEDEIEDAFNNAWDELEESYKEDMVNQMTEAFILGSDRAFEFAKNRLEELLKEDADKASKIKLNFKIFKKDIYNYLLKESGTRIKGIKETTRNLIREELAKGFDNNLGWKEIMKRIEPIICDQTRAETIAKTDLSFAYERSNIKVYEKAGFSRVQCDETIDNKTCTPCKERNGTVYSIDDCPGLAHPRCRVTWLPVD